jgi:hypothetical protein
MAQEKLSGVGPRLAIAAALAGGGPREPNSLTSP